MGKKVNVQKGKKGFQPTAPKAVTPTGKRGLMSRLFGKEEKYTPLVPDGNYSTEDWNKSYDFFNANAPGKTNLDDWGTSSTSDFDFFAETSPTTSTESPDHTQDLGKYRFGPHAVAHAQIDAHRQEILDSLAQSESYETRGANGQNQTVSLNFNPTKTRPIINRLAYQVLEESGYFDQGNPKYRSVSGVYSKETVRCAERILTTDGDTFAEQRHPNESTSMFPCEVSKTSDSVSYKYYIHSDISTLVHGVEKDQKGHAKLQSEIAEQRQRSAGSAAKNKGFDESDW